MPLLDEFKTDTLAFMAKYAMCVPESTDVKLPRAGVYKFHLSQHEGDPKLVQLVPAPFGTHPDKCITAYWLPWELGKVKTLLLEAEADYMFTSEMTNCRFSVLTGLGSRVMVSHASGTLGSGAMDHGEIMGGFPLPPEQRLIPSATMTAIKKNLLVPIVRPQGAVYSTLAKAKQRAPNKPNDEGLMEGAYTNPYHGQDSPDPTSAFVYGIRDKGSGKWVVRAQVVQGNLSDVARFIEEHAGRITITRSDYAVSK
jgi:hypothetical protein